MYLIKSLLMNVLLQAGHHGLVKYMLASVGDINLKGSYGCQEINRTEQE
jgi:hypothetical protein